MCILIGFVYTTLGIVNLVAIVIPGWAAFIVIGVVLFRSRIRDDSTCL